MTGYNEADSYRLLLKTRKNKKKASRTGAKKSKSDKSSKRIVDRYTSHRRSFEYDYEEDPYDEA